MRVGSTQIGKKGKEGKYEGKQHSAQAVVKKKTLDLATATPSPWRFYLLSTIKDTIYYLRCRYKINSTLWNERTNNLIQPDDIRIP